MILFPRHPIEKKLPDPSFKEEFEAAVAAGFKIGLVDTDNGVYVHANIPALYRGWIIKPGQYEDLCTAEPNLIVRFSDYMNSYNFPEWYSQVFPSTPRSVCFHGKASGFTDLSIQLWGRQGNSGAFPTLASLKANSAVIVKDWVKSRKHEWFDACFIPDLSDHQNLYRVVTNFINGQGDDLVGGLVFREFVKLKMIGSHPKSGLPLANEHRFFVFKGQIFYSAPYWDAHFYNSCTSLPPQKKIIIDLATHIKSKFYAIDVAEKEDGSWIVVEVNDGGTAGIPEGGSAYEFYQALRELL